MKRTCMSMTLAAAALAVVALAGAAGCESHPPADGGPPANSTVVGGNQSGPGNGTADQHGPGHDDRTMSVDGMH